MIKQRRHIVPLISNPLLEHEVNERVRHPSDTAWVPKAERAKTVNKEIETGEYEKLPEQKIQPAANASGSPKCTPSNEEIKK
jgi:hypothetical protein